MDRKHPSVIYITPSKMESVEPDANNYYRFATTFLSSIGKQEVQTSDGVINLAEEHEGPKLNHNDNILVVARCIEKGRFEGTIRKVNKLAALRFR